MEDHHDKDNIVDQLTVPARIFSRRKAVLSEKIQRAERLHSLRNEYIVDLLATIGNETYPEYRRVRAEIKRNLRSLPKPTFVTLNDLSGETSALSEISAKSQQLIASLGVNGEKVKQIQRTYTDKARLELESPQRDKNDVPAREAADMFRALSSTPIPNVTFSSVVTYSFDEGTPHAWRHIAVAGADLSTQNLDTECRIAIGGLNATDNEFALTTAEAGLSSDFFTVPTDGTVAVWVNLGARDVVHRGFAVNDWGVSDLFGWTEMRCVVRLWHIAGAIDEMGGAQTFYKTSVYEPGSLSPPSSWNVVLINQGDQRAFLFKSSQSWRAGDSMQITVGVDQFTAAWADDVTYQADVTSNWTISGISLQVIP
jgi:hypothetical protein